MNQNNKFLLKILFFGIIIMAVYKFFPYIEEGINSFGTEKFLKVIFLIILLLFFIYTYSSRKSHSTSINSMILWALIFIILIVVYAFRFELESLKNRIFAVLIPSYSWTNEQGQLVIARSKDGHFYLNAVTSINKKIRFLVDTGASDIALTKEAAVKLGINLKKLRYTKKYYTANGVSYAAPVRIKQLTIGKKTFYDLEGHVTSGGLDTPLLGMSLIEDFSNFKITKDMLILSY